MINVLRNCMKIWFNCDLSDGIEKKSKFNKEKLPGILTSSAVFLVGTLITGLILSIWKKKLRNQGKNWILRIHD